ncbi:hypothetical protein [Aquimarina brevivitae]|uniref:hypothetical protein n=1 Tax=Aquimarina brevivitae TaxID=323412 RepID=UPI001028C392|nr:hypothetical protein [Aquimarina brevivitae]
MQGTYYSVENGFERWSIMELSENGIFIYKYGLSACQAEITGTYSIENNRIRFKNDKEFTKEYLESERESLVKLDSTFAGIEIPIYPDLSLTEWKIKKNSIKPISEIDSGCITEKGKHIKR